MNNEIPGRIAGYTEMNPHRPDPWDTSASARAEIVREAARLAERDRIDQLARTIAERLMPEDEQEDAEPSPDIDAIERQAKRDHAAGVRAGRFVRQVFYVLAVLGAVWTGAWALAGLVVGGGGRP